MPSFSITVKTTAACLGYCLLEYNGKQYSVDRLPTCMHSVNDKGELQQIIEHSMIHYMGQTRTFNEYKTDEITFSEALKVGEYLGCIHTQAPFISMVDQEYYWAARMLESLEMSLMNARCYLLNAHDILHSIFNISLNGGYIVIFDLRCMAANTSIMWYNTVYDALLQMPFLGYRLYRFSSKYKSTMNLDDILKLCSYNQIERFCTSNLGDSSIGELWKILSRATEAVKNTREWANQIKHRGGLKYAGAEPESPLRIIRENDGGTYDSIENDVRRNLVLDEVIEELSSVHDKLFICIHDLVEFMNIFDVTPTSNDGAIVYPQEQSYRRIII